MESKARLLGHSVHQMLVPIPIGLFFMATGCDVIVMAGWAPSLANVSFCNLFAGIGAALAAAVFGTINATGIPRQSRASRVALFHGIGNGLVVALFAGSVLSRWDIPGQTPTTTGFALELAGFLLIVATSWMGGELVVRLGVGVDDHANVNAPSSLGLRRFASKKVDP